MNTMMRFLKLRVKWTRYMCEKLINGLCGVSAQKIKQKYVNIFFHIIQILALRHHSADHRVVWSFGAAAVQRAC